MSPLEIDVPHNEITVTVPGTNYMATYYKPETLGYLSQSACRTKTTGGRA